MFLVIFLFSSGSVLEAGEEVLSGNAYFSSTDKPKLIPPLMETAFRIPSKLLCSLFAISKTTCLNKR